MSPSRAVASHRWHGARARVLQAARRGVQHLDPEGTSEKKFCPRGLQAPFSVPVCPSAAESPVAPFEGPLARCGDVSVASSRACVSTTAFASDSVLGGSGAAGVGAASCDGGFGARGAAFGAGFAAGAAGFGFAFGFGFGFGLACAAGAACAAAGAVTAGFGLGFGLDFAFGFGFGFGFAGAASDAREPRGS